MNIFYENPLHFLFVTAHQSRTIFGFVFTSFIFERYSWVFYMHDTLLASIKYKNQNFVTQLHKITTLCAKNTVQIKSRTFKTEIYHFNYVLDLHCIRFIKNTDNDYDLYFST